MRRVVSVLMAVCLVAGVVGITSAFAAIPSLSIDTNAEILFRELNACREAVLPEVDPSAYIQITPPWEPAVLRAAEILDSLGAKEIVEIEVAFDIEDRDLFGFYDVRFTDKDGKVYNMSMYEEGDISVICNESGEWIWFDDFCGLGLTLVPAPKWWQSLSPILQFLLRYLFFGWIWMK